MTKRTQFKCFKTSPEIIRVAVKICIRFPLSLRSFKDLLHERGIDICHETVPSWWHGFGPMFAAETRRRRVGRMRTLPKLASAHASVSNHFNLERTPASRQDY